MEAFTVFVAEEVTIIRAGVVSLLTADGMTAVGEAADYDARWTSARIASPPV